MSQNKGKDRRKMKENLLRISNLHINAGDKEILKGLNLEINKGEIHVIMGPNGAGKSTLVNAIFNNPIYTRTEGTIELEGENINELKTDERARKGIFMSFQSPEEVPGISVINFLKASKAATTQEPVKIFQLKKEIENNMKELSMKSEYIQRDLNVGFSGGEKKKNEILQMLTLSPKLAILDETDSGLDVDAIRIVSKGIKMFSNNKNGVLIITHGTKILEELNVDYVHVLVDGKIIKTSTGDLAKTIEVNGYEEYKAEERM